MCIRDRRTPADALSFYLDKTVTFTAKDSVKYAKLSGSKVNDDNVKYKACLLYTSRCV